MQIEQTSGNSWSVHSDSGGVYTVRYCGSGDGDPDYIALWSCTCKAGNFGRVCKHITAVSQASDAYDNGDPVPEGVVYQPEEE